MSGENINLIRIEDCQLQESYTPDNNTDDKKYTVDGALRSIGLGLYHFKWVPAIALSACTQSSMVALAPLLMTKLECQWDLHTFHETVVLFVLFFGNVPGDVISGLLSDKKGRKVSIIIGQIMMLAATTISAFSPNYWVFVMSYFFIGIAIGMLTFIIVVQLSEISPPDFRSYSITIFYVFWALGALYSCLMTFFLLNSRGWVVTTLVVGIPQVLVAIILIFVDESPKYLAISGNIPAAERLLNKMATQNKRNLNFTDKLVCEAQCNRGSIKELLHTDLRRQFILLFGIFLSAGTIVYSCYSMLPYMIQKEYCGYHDNSANTTSTPCTFSDETLKETSMITTAEVIMIPIFAFANELFGRIKTMRVLAAVLFLASFFLVFCMGNWVFITCLYIQRGAVQSLFLILYIYTPECFPTHIRGISCGLIFMAMVLGGVLSSMIVYPIGVLHGFSNLVIILAVCSACPLAGVFFITSETKGTDLP